MIKADIKEVLNGKNDDKYITPAALLKFWKTMKKNDLLTDGYIYGSNDIPFLKWNGVASVLASNGDGVYFRPNGVNNSVGQAFVHPNGDFHISQNLYLRNNPTVGRNGIVMYMAGTDFAYIVANANANDEGYLDLSTGDGGNEPIRAIQWYGEPYIAGATVARTMYLLDANGNTSVPQNLYVGAGATFGANVYAPNYYCSTNTGLKAIFGTNVHRFGMVGTPYLEVLTDNINGITAWGINVWSSDKRLKNSIEDTKINGLDIIKQIKHREFKYNHSDEFVKVGYVADELQEIDESLVFEVGEDKLKQPKESVIIPVLSKAIQEQQELIEKQSNVLNLLEERIKVLEEKLNKVEDENEILD